jgi:hypothetical protein
MIFLNILQTIYNESFDFRSVTQRARKSGSLSTYSTCRSISFALIGSIMNINQ